MLRTTSLTAKSNKVVIRRVATAFVLVLANPYARTVGARAHRPWPDLIRPRRYRASKMADLFCHCCQPIVAKTLLAKDLLQAPPGSPEPPIPATISSSFPGARPQQWWPGRTPSEVIVGASYSTYLMTNVEHAIQNLKSGILLKPRARRVAQLLEEPTTFRVLPQRLGPRFSSNTFTRCMVLMSYVRTPIDRLRGPTSRRSRYWPETADSFALRRQTSCFCD